MFIKKIKVASSWMELNEWQLQAIAHLYLHADPQDFESAYQNMIFILFQKKPGFWHRLRMYWIINQVPITELEKYARFLVDSTMYHRFPDVPSLLKPADRLGNITIKHFSAIDTFYDAYENKKSELHLKRFVASLYRLREEFDELLLPEVAKVTDKLPIRAMEQIALAYKFVRLHIFTLYPIIFPPTQKEEQELKGPQFIKKQKYMPFEKIMVGLAMDDLQPLGKKQDINGTRIYEFMNVLTESILHHREKQKQK